MLGFGKQKNETLVCTKFVRGEFSDDGHSFLVLKCVKAHEDPEKAKYKIHRYGTVLDSRNERFGVKDFGMEVPATSLSKAIDYMAIWEDQQIRRGKTLEDNIGLLNQVHFENRDQRPDQSPPNLSTPRADVLKRIGQEIADTTPWTYKETSGLTGGPNLRAAMSDRVAAYQLQAQIAGHGIEAHVGRKGKNGNYSYVLIVPEQEFEKLDKMAAKAKSGQKQKPRGQHM